MHLRSGRCAPPSPCVCQYICVCVTDQCLFSVLFLVESSLVIDKTPLPVWLPIHVTAHDIVSTLHRMFPAYMHGCRCILGAVQGPAIPQRIAGLAVLADVQNKTNVALVKVAKQVKRKFCLCVQCCRSRGQSEGGAPCASQRGGGPAQTWMPGGGGGVVQRALGGADVVSDVSAVEEVVGKLSAGDHLRPSTTTQHSYQIVYLLVFIVVTCVWHAL